MEQSVPPCFAFFESILNPQILLFLSYYIVIYIKHYLQKMASLHTGSTKEYEDESVNRLEKTGRSCDRLRQELKRCIKESDCVQIDRRPAAECVQARDGRVPDRCYTLMTTFSDCKRSLVSFLTSLILLQLEI